MYGIIIKIKAYIDISHPYVIGSKSRREVMQRNGDRQAVWCRFSGRSVSGRRSTAPKTHENEAEIFYNALNVPHLL
jgi:hypothetical protein